MYNPLVCKRGICVSLIILGICKYGKSDEQTRLTHEYPYRLTCPHFVVDDRDNNDDFTPYTVVLSYHVGMFRNWKTVVKDQVNTLTKCGLASIASKLIISYSGGSVIELIEVLKESKLTINVTSFVHSARVPWEGIIMEEIQKTCEKQKHVPTIVFYFHTKGISKYKKQWKFDLIQRKTYSYGYMLYWRKYLEYFTLERPGICINHIIKNNASTCSANLQYWPWSHYSGNFWSASCDYLLSLPSINMTSNDYFAAEKWIGTRMTTDSKAFVDLGKYSHKSLNINLVTPEMFSDYSRRWHRV